MTSKITYEIKASRTDPCDKNVMALDQYNRSMLKLFRASYQNTFNHIAKF